MLEGIERNSIIVGAYSDQDGICPMLAAHRAGGRTNFIGFARAWDAFAFRGSRRCGARRASQRELLVLRTHLEASLLEDDCPIADLDSAVSEHRELVARRAAGSGQATTEAPATRLPAATARAGDPDRSRELRRRPGWRWMRVVRSVEEFETVLAALEEDAPSGQAPRGSVLAGRE